MPQLRFPFILANVATRAVEVDVVVVVRALLVSLANWACNEVLAD